MSLTAKKVTFIVALLPLVVFGVASLAFTAQAVLAFCSLWGIGVMLVVPGLYLIFGRQQAISTAPRHHYVSTPPVQEAVQHESQYEPVVVSYPKGLYD